MRIKDKVALITGGGTGIGRATAELFAEEGAKVAVTGRRLEPLQEVVEAIEAKGGQCIAIQQDVADEQQWDLVVDQVATHFGRLDILVNNAGIVVPANTEDTTVEIWDQTQNINAKGVFLGTRAAIKMMKGEGGAIVNVSSIEGLVGEPNAAAYNASKGAVRLYTKSAAIHCAQQGYGIRINSLHPGLIETPMTTTNVVDYVGEEMAEQMLQSIFAKIPMGRIAEPREMATGILFLSCDDSSYMTGSELVMDGGYTAQ